MKIITLFLIGLFMLLGSSSFANPTEYKFQVIQTNPNFQDEMILLKATTDIIHNQIQKEGVEPFVNRILSGNRTVHAYSDMAFMTILFDRCKLIFHAFGGDFSSSNFCTDPDLIGLLEAVDRAIEGKSTIVKFVMKNPRMVKGQDGEMVRGVVLYYMEGFIIKFGKYAIILNTTSNIKLKTPQKHINGSPSIPFPRKLKMA